MDITRTNLEPLVNVRELAALLGVSECAVYRRARRGAIPSVKFGRALRFDVAAVLDAITNPASDTDADDQDARP